MRGHCSVCLQLSWTGTSLPAKVRPRDLQKSADTDGRVDIEAARVEKAA